MKNGNIRNATIGLICLTFISKVLGFVREMVISYMYGASAMSDAYSMANSIAVLIVTGFASGIMVAYIPSSMEISDSKIRNRFTNNVLSTAILGGGGLGAFCFIFTEPMVSVLGIGFAEDTRLYTIILFRFVIAASICILIIYIISGYLQTKQNFFYGGVQLVITNLIIIAAVIISEKNPYELGIGYFMAYLFPMLLGFYYLRKYHFTYNWEIDFSDSRLKKLYLISVIAFLGTNVVKIDVMIDRVFASSLEEGTVAALNYAFTLISIFPEVFVMSIATVGYPKLSKWFAQKNKHEFCDYIRVMLVNTSIILLPATILFLEMGEWIIQILFQRGAFGREDTLLTVEILNGYSYGMLGIGFGFILCKVFFARKEEWIPAACLGIGIIINVILNIFVGYESAYQLAVTTSLSVTCSILLMMIILFKKCPEISRRKLGIVTFKMLLAAGFMKCALSMGMKMGRLSDHTGTIQSLFTLAIVAAVSLFVYIAFLYLEGVEEIQGIFAMIKGKGRRIR